MYRQISANDNVVNKLFALRMVSSFQSSYTAGAYFIHLYFIYTKAELAKSIGTTVPLYKIYIPVQTMTVQELQHR